MDLEKISEQLAILRQRRETLPEIRDYKPQARKTTKKAEPATAVGTRSTEDVFAGLFATEETNELSTNDGGSGDSPPQSPTGDLGA